MLGPKVAIWRSERYRRFVASKDCFACGRGGISQAAHQNLGKGSRLKTDDSLTFPLCCTQPMRVGCHDQHDLLIDMTLEQRREAEVLYVDRMQAIAVEAGWDFDARKVA